MFWVYIELKSTDVEADGTPLLQLDSSVHSSVAPSQVVEGSLGVGGAPKTGRARENIAG